jgi:hypothetical protein
LTASTTRWERIVKKPLVDAKQQSLHCHFSYRRLPNERQQRPHLPSIPTQQQQRAIIMRLFQQQPSLLLVAVVLSSWLFCGCFGATAVDVNLQHEISSAKTAVVGRTSSPITSTTPTRSLLRKQQSGPATMVLAGVRDDDSDHDSRKRMLQQGGDNKEGNAVDDNKEEDGFLPDGRSLWLFILIVIVALICFSGLFCFCCCADLLCAASLFECF